MRYKIDNFAIYFEIFDPLIMFFLKENHRTLRIDQKKTKFQFLKKTAWTIIGQQMQGVKPKKRGRISFQAAQGLRKIIKKAHNKKKTKLQLSSYKKGPIKPEGGKKLSMEDKKETTEILSVIDM